MLCKRNSGFTLIELMVVIAIVAIFVALAFPSFEGTIRSNRVSTSANELMASMALARAEAIRSARGSGLCTSADGATCGGTWNDGWIVWIDADANGTPGGANDRIVRRIQARNALSLTATSSGGSTTLLRFDPRGRVLDGNTRVITLKPATCTAGADMQRALALSTTGQTRVTRENCP